MDTMLQKVLSKEKVKEIIGKRVAKEFKNNQTITLGIGLPNEAIKYIDKNINVTIQSENGVLGLECIYSGENSDKKIINSGGIPSGIKKGACFYDSQTAFSMMRGGHIDITVLGALQADEEGSIASWQIPGVFTPGIGGSMDLIVGAKKVIIAMEHLSKGKIKIMKKCTLPLTAYREANLIITERCVFVVEEDGLLLTEINPIYTLDDIKESTEASFKVSPNLAKMEI